jgi:hypothetical protein
MEYIKDRMENYNKYKVGLEDWAKHLDNNYYNVEAMKRIIFDIQE